MEEGINIKLQKSIVRRCSDDVQLLLTEGVIYYIYGKVLAFPSFILDGVVTRANNRINF